MFMWWYNRKLRSRDLSVVVTAAQKLRERYGEKAVVPLKRAVPKLIAALSHSIPEIRETAITMLGYLGDQRAAEPLVRVLSKA